MQAFETEGNATIFLIQIENVEFDFFSQAKHIAGMGNPAPRQLRDVNQPFDTTEIHKNAKIGDRGHPPVDPITALEFAEQFDSLAGRGQGSPLRKDDILLLVVTFDHFERQGLADIRGQVFHQHVLRVTIGQFDNVGAG